MNWLSQNWLWIVLILGAAYLVFGNHHRWRGFGHHGNGGSSGAGGFGHGDHGAAESSAARSQHPGQAAPAIDPVSRKDVSTTTALTSIYQGRIYYFETAENRQRFEAAPEQYAREGLGHSLGPAEGARAAHRPRRRGC